MRKFVLVVLMGLPLLTLACDKDVHEVRGKGTGGGEREVVAEGKA